MSCQNTGGIECDTVQIIEPRDDFLVDTGGTTSDIDERGTMALEIGQQRAFIEFEVPKLHADYHFEYLYVTAEGHAPPVHPGAVQVIVVGRTPELCALVFAGSPIDTGYILNWRVTIARSGAIVQVDAPENLYLQMPQATIMGVTFVNPRSNASYGFSELRVENLVDGPDQHPVHVQVYYKNVNGFFVGVSPMPRTDNYYLKVRTP